MRLFKYIVLLISILIVSCEKDEFELSENADEFFFLRNDGTDLPVWIKGNTASKIMIVYLHGGPVGSGAIGEWPFLNGEFFKSITKDYAMVLFDQRGSGSSQGHYDKDILNPEQQVDDLNKLILLLNNKYGSDINVFLYGVSYGGYLGNAYLTTADYQSKIKGWINDSGSHNHLLNANAGKQMVVFYANQQISLNKNVDEWSEMLTWFESKDTILELKDFGTAYRYLNQARRLMRDSIHSSIVWDSEVVNQTKYNSPYSASSDFSNRLFNHFIAENFDNMDLTDKMYLIETPTLLVRGKYDFSVPQEVVDEAFSLISSDIKYKVTYENAGHCGWIFEPKEFTRLFKQFVSENIYK
jgi:pimeloyl-ACP methyl ester carboxylesterase